MPPGPNRSVAPLGWVVERRRVATNKDVEQIVRHLTSLSLLRSSNDFPWAGYPRRGTIWPSVLSELRCARGWLICRQRLDSGCSWTVTAFDACASGHPSVDADLEPSDCLFVSRALEMSGWRPAGWDLVSRACLAQLKEAVREPVSLVREI